jgi:hypothetical protein
MKTILQILTVCGLFLEVLGAFYRARCNGLWQEIFRLKAGQRNSSLGSFLFGLFENKGVQSSYPPRWRVDSLRGVLCLFVGFLCQIPSVVRAIFY